MDPSHHKEFRASGDGRYVAVGSDHGEVCVIHVADKTRYDLPEVSYSWGGRRLAVDSQSDVLFCGAYHDTGIAAYEFKTGNCIWHRRDLKRLQKIAYDSRDNLVLCAFEGRASKPLKPRDGRERIAIRGLKDFYLSRDSSIALFEFQEVKLENRAASVQHVLRRESLGILNVAFTLESVAISWISGPVVSYDSETGEELWRYAPQGTHAYRIAPSAVQSAVWVAEQPFQEPPWQRLRLLSKGGEILREIRCDLGHSFEILPYCDNIIRADTVVTPLDMLE